MYVLALHHLLVLRLALDTVDIGARNDVPSFHITVHTLGQALLFTTVETRARLGNALQVTLFVDFLSSSST